MTNTAYRQPLRTTLLQLDPLAQLDTVKVNYSDLRPGMVLVDEELGCAAGILSENLGNVHGGLVQWRYFDMDHQCARRTTFGRNLGETVTVAAA